MVLAAFLQPKVATIAIRRKKNAGLKLVFTALKIKGKKIRLKKTLLSTRAFISETDLIKNN